MRDLENAMVEDKWWRLTEYPPPEPRYDDDREDPRITREIERERQAVSAEPGSSGIR